MEIKVKDVSKVLKKQEVLKDINFEFTSGKIYGIHGINGSGKTMLLRVISGLVKPSSGEVVIDGKILGQNMSFIPNLGLCFADVRLNQGVSGFDNLKALSSINSSLSDEEINAVIRRVGLDPNNKKKVKSYSLGMNQRINIAQAIMEKPDVIIMDEPTNGLDTDGVELVRNILEQEKERGALIILTSHNKEDIEILADEKIKISEGMIVSE